MFAKALVRQGHIRRFIVSPTGRDGWELRLEEDGAVVARRSYTDWHRVERALASIERDVAALEREGWREAALAL